MDSNERPGAAALAAYALQTRQFRLGGLLDLKSEFQRPLDKNRVKKIQEAWNADLWDMPIVNIHPDTFDMSLVDGQHRVAAAVATLTEDTMVECRITHVADPGRLFVAINTSKRRVSALDIFKALVDAGDPVAMSTAALAGKHGFRVVHGSEARIINAARILQNLYSLDVKALDKTLETASALIDKHNNERGWVNAAMIHALCWFYRTTDASPKDLIPRLDKYSSYAVIRHPVYDMMNVMNIAAIYNKGRQERNHVNPAESPLWKKGART